MHKLLPLMLMFHIAAHPAPRGVSVTTARANVPMETAVGNISACSTTPLPGADAVRVVISWYDQASRTLPCATEAADNGLRVLLAVQYDNCAAPSQDAAQMTSVLNTYQAAGVRPYSVSVGNEQELPQASSCNTAATPATYSATWHTVEPLIDARAPWAVRVAGEISPWGDGFIAKAADDGLPGANAYAAHVYPDNTNPLAVTAEFALIARQHHVQAWATEGLCGPGAWARYGCLGASTLSDDGYTLASEWYSDSDPIPPGSASVFATATSYQRNTQ